MNSLSSYVAGNWYWMVAALASGGLLAWPHLKGGLNTGGVSPAQAVQLINREKGVLIDVRDSTEYTAAHIAGAKNVPLADLAAGSKGLPGNKTLPLIVVCATGARAAKAVAQLQALGYQNVQSLAGGQAAWREANLPIDKA